MKAIFEVLGAIAGLLFSLYVMGYACWLFWFVDVPTMRQLGVGLALVMLSVAFQSSSKEDH